MSAIVRELGIRSALANPVVVEGELWGAITTGSFDRALPATAERRLRDFTELVATAVANTQSRTEVEQLAKRLGALQRVATLVAKESAPEEVFAKVPEEVSQLLGVADCSLWRDERDGTATVVAVSDPGIAGLQVGSRWPVDGDGVLASALREGRPLILTDTTRTHGTIADRGRELGIRSAAACPIVVGGRVWGAMGAARYQSGAFPPGTAESLAQFADLVATAIANAEARGEVARLADEQAALRRLATLVAQRVGAEPVFQAVADEVAALFGSNIAAIVRFEPHGTVTVMGDHGGPHGPGARAELSAGFVVAAVRETGQAARFDTDDPTGADRFAIVRELGIRSALANPVVVEGE